MITGRGAMAALLVGVLLAAGGCADTSRLVSSQDHPPTSAPEVQQPDVDADDVDDFYDQDVAWSPCDDAECAAVAVPMDYRDPAGDTVTLRLVRLPATGERIGSIFVNPGGPGGSGIDFADSFGSIMRDEVLERYDVVGFDPRGVGLSDPLRCRVSDEAIDESLEGPFVPSGPAEIGQSIATAVDLGQQCLQTGGELLGHVSTIEVAKDLDVLRELVGDAELTYYGASYGTSIGATYAELFPDKVGRLVLDAAVDPTLEKHTDRSLEHARHIQRHLDAYIAACLTQEDCPLAGGIGAGARQIRALLDSLGEQPLPTDDPDRPLSGALAFVGIESMLHDKQAWPELTEALTGALDGEGIELLDVADDHLGRVDGEYESDGDMLSTAVACLDAPGGLAVVDVERSIPQFRRVSPEFGDAFAWWGMGCITWPVKPAYEPREIRAEGASPIVVIGTRSYTVTPYEWSVTMAEQLESGVLVSLDGDAHGAFGEGNECVDEAVDAFLLDGTVPDDGLQC